MKRSYLFIGISSLALAVVLLIQLNWIFETAKVKEELFNEKANMVLARTIETLSADNITSAQLKISVGKNEIHKIDSLLKHYMDFYDFHVDYRFELASRKPAILSSNLFPAKMGPENKQACYQKGLDGLSSEGGYELKLILPEKKEFIRQEMGVFFLTSVVLIVVVLLLFWRTVSSLLTEKKIAEHTTDYLNNMTHEFKTPLTNIGLASKMILKETKHKELSPQELKIRHYSGIIREENEKLRLQIEQVLSMTALERGEIPIQKTELDFHELIQEALLSMRLQIEQKHGELKLKQEALHFRVMGDKTHLLNALCNLLDNAIKYSGDRPELSIETSNEGQNLLVRVSDKGIGIEKKYQKRVFEKYFRVPTGDIHDVKGFGLGLAYLKKIMELHQGTLTLQSENTRGAKKELETSGKSGCTFTLTLPYV